MGSNQDSQSADISRRSFLGQAGLGGAGLGFGAMAAGSMLSAEEQSSARRTASVVPRAKSVIYLHMSGGPPQQDIFDYKPKLQELHHKPCPEEFFQGKRLAFIKGHPTLLGPPHRFRQVGQSGRWVTEQMPHFASISDEVCVIRSMYTDQINHAPAELMLFTGSPQFGYASMGSWVLYGLGSPNRDLPGYVVMLSGSSDPTGGKSLWGSGALPSHYQGTLLRAGGNPVLYVSNPKGMDRGVRRGSLDTLRDLNSQALGIHGDPETRSRIEQYELAYRMQASVPEATSIGAESKEVLDLYGCDPNQKSFARNCLQARRLVERGVRFVHLFDWGWDLHGTSPGDDLMSMFPRKCLETDQAVAALILDLKRRGLLDETLVVWGGEFGRTPMNEARNGSTYLGRDHHPGCFSMWLAGAGVKPGTELGATDELGYSIVENPISVRDLQATILHTMGLDPERLSIPTKGLRQRLIGPAEGPRVIEELFT
ncbi:MAG: hypothetical protein ACI8QS_001902 [Planctomycetota bacterium]|jgi:hypothetical protein